MSAVTKTLTDASRPKNLRPFDPRRDLNQVADLVELCFADTLDQDGHNYLRQMRSAARSSSYWYLLGMASERYATPLSGFVWEEDGRVVGNLSLIPYAGINYSNYLIANVAVHPEYRRLGIARGLTSAAIEQARRRRAQSVWLHVRAENSAAKDLYRSLGFVERASRTTWQSRTESTADRLFRQEVQPAPDRKSEIQIGRRYASDWDTQRLWLKKLYPSSLLWHLALRSRAIQPGAMSFFYRALNNMDLRHWSARRGSRLLGVMTWQASMGYSDHLWLAVDPDGDETAVAPLLKHALRCCSPRRMLSLDYPAGKAVQAIHSAGFQEHQTLIWMSLDLTK
jgi:ribosomal protein S18 acetylase RimI-like enzyme